MCFAKTWTLREPGGGGGTGGSGQGGIAPRHGIRYAAFADVSGGRHDDATLAVAHREDRLIVLDSLERYKTPHNPYEVVAAMADVLRRYGCDRATGDAYRAEWCRTAFRSAGIDYNRASTSAWKEGASALTKTAKPKSTLYAELLPRLNAGELKLLDNDTLVSQLASLERRTSPGHATRLTTRPAAKTIWPTSIPGDRTGAPSSSSSSSAPKLTAPATARRCVTASA